ncbi:MAG: cation:proton antiporter [Cryomorphaceae bacterium]|nr:cation:proton antiporter [Flavobacteriales bacterium]
MTLLASATEIPFLSEIVVILGLSILVIYGFQKLNVPAVLGFLATGVIFGPHAFGLVRAGEEIEMLSEIGVILLLFIIGLEFSLKNLMAIKKIVLLGGAFQVLVTIFATAGISYLLGFELNTAVFIGFLFALSSTAIVLKVLQDRGMMRTAHGRIALGVLIFQDIIVVPMMLLTPILSGIEGSIVNELLILLVKVVLVIGLIYVSARYLVPRLLHEIARTRSRELFLITIIVICFAVAYITSAVGLSLALGAFAAGLCISESEYSHQATGLIIPFREIFTSFFFVSIGMLLDLGFLIDHIGIILAITVTAVIIKFSILIGASAILKYPLKTSVIVGFSLFQVGEFAFILSRTGIEYGLLDDITNQYFLSVSILTMGLTPFAMMYSEKLASKLLRTPFGRLENDNAEANPEASIDDTENLKNHLVIIGYGTNGGNAARAAREAKIPYIVVDFDPDIVRKARDAGERIIYGDARNMHILDHVHVYKARVAVVAVQEHDDALAIISQIREICRTVHIVIRAKTITQAEELQNAGASEAISEEFEASIEVFARMLNQFLVGNEEIDKYIDIIRDENYSAIHSNYHFYKKDAVELSNLKTEKIDIGNSCPFTDKHLCEVKILEKHLVRILAIIRKGKLIKDFTGDSVLHEGDEVVLAGTAQNVNLFMDEWKELMSEEDSALAS